MSVLPIHQPPPPGTTDVGSAETDPRHILSASPRTDQPGLTLDDGTGLRVAQSRFVEDRKFSWALFAGFTSCRILTYSVDLRTVNRLVTDFEFDEIECIIGTTATIDRIEKVLAVQHAALQSAKVLIDELSRTEQSVITALTEGRLAFRVLHRQVSHSKLYILDGGADPQQRIIMGSANFSEQAFGGWQEETIAAYDDDPGAWIHYGGKYGEIREQASQIIDPRLLSDRNRPIEVHDVPILSDAEARTVLMVGDGAGPGCGLDDRSATDRRAKIIRNQIGSHVPAARVGKHTLTRTDKRNIREALRVRPPEEREPAALSLDRINRSATFAGKPFDLSYDPDSAAADARLMVDYFQGFDNFAGTTTQIDDLKAQYFTLWAWLYFSPFICELRNRAALQNRDVIRYERVAIVYGKANCGKSTLVRTLLRSMFPTDPLGPCQPKSNFRSGAPLPRPAGQTALPAAPRGENRRRLGDAAGVVARRRPDHRARADRPVRARRLPLGRGPLHHPRRRRSQQRPHGPAPQRTRTIPPQLGRRADKHRRVPDRTGDRFAAPPPVLGSPAPTRRVVGESNRRIPDTRPSEMRKVQLAWLPLLQAAHSNAV